VPEIQVVLLAGVTAGVLNAVGGGGSFVALPVLVAAGLPPVTANAATTVALLPGAAASTWVYRRDLTTLGSMPTTALTAMSVLGGGIGAGLLLVLPAVSFDAALPWLLAFATAVLAFGRCLSRALSTARRRPTTLGPRAILAGQFVLALYGGYFGGAVGLLMAAFWSAGLGLDTAVGNSMRVAQLAAVYLTAAVIFLVASNVMNAPLALGVLVAGAVAGGFAGAHLARRLPARLLRGLVLTSAVTMTAVYFLKGPG
jgi:uncharacterized membrane protein YfcA